MNIQLNSTGVIRRIDDLGRVVIANEIRRRAGIKEGDPLETFVIGNAVVLMKYNPNGKYELATNPKGIEDCARLVEEVKKTVEAESCYVIDGDLAALRETLRDAHAILDAYKR